MKVKGTDFARLIREIVKDELGKVLPEMIQRQLSEGYIKRLVSETTTSRRLPFSEEEEVIPEPLRNDDEDIYQKSHLIKTNEVTHKLLSKDNPLAHLYENVQPVSQASSTSMSSPGVKLEALGMNVGVMKKLAGVSKNTKKQDNSAYEEKMKELEVRRKMLDTKVDNN